MAQEYLTMNQEKVQLTMKNKFQSKSDLVLTSWYPLNLSESKYVIIGSSPYKNFNIFVKIVSTNSSNVIYFTPNQWNMLMQKENEIMEFLHTDIPTLNGITMENLEITSYLLSGKKILQFETSNSCISLASSSIIKLYDINHIIDCDIVELQNMKLGEYFNNFLYNLDTGGAQIFYNWSKGFFYPIIKQVIDPFYRKFLYVILEYFPNCIDQFYENKQ